MAFGFPARHTEQIQLEVDRQIAREAICGVLDQLGWRYENPYPDSFTARVPFSGSSWGETLKLSFLADGELEIRSECTRSLVLFQMFDWGKNKRNVETFLTLFRTKADWISRLTPISERFETKESTPLQRALDEETA